MNTTSPCMDCPDRAVGCHGRCEQYKAFRAEKEKEYAFRHEQYVIDMPTADFERKTRRKLLQKARYNR